MFYRLFGRSLLFSIEPERAHELALAALERLSPGLPPARPLTDATLRTQVCGIEFPNPVGLAAGCDKNGVAIQMWPRFGFGFAEIGTITGQPQAGNPKPRVFRYPHERALVNRLGFNSEGSLAVAARLEKVGATRVPLAINIGKTKLVEGDEGTVEDYVSSLDRLARFADLIVVNVSSPNTPGLRDWQQTGRIRLLVRAICTERDVITRGIGRAIPICVKLAPDMSDEELVRTAGAALDAGAEGIVATNTTVARPGEAAGIYENGGLSGRPLCDRADEIIRVLYRVTEGKVPLIGVGGIFTAEDAWRRMLCGASLVQLYTAMIFEGPLLARRINEGLIRLCERARVTSIRDIVGAGVDSALRI